MSAATAVADGPTDNIIAQVRRIPPLGVEVPDDVRTGLQAKLALVEAWLQNSGAKLKDEPGALALVPDPQKDAVGEWVTKEMEHAITHWRQQFRGDARVKDDRDISDEDIAAHNLVLWGDPSSNAVLAKIADKLPIRWGADSISVGEKTFAAGDHALVMIFPNPLNPERYVVLNSGFTYREYDYLNNARQTPKLPDWAIIDVREPVTSQWPGGIPAAGFFGEQWQLQD